MPKSSTLNTTRRIMKKLTPTTTGLMKKVTKMQRRIEEAKNAKITAQEAYDLMMSDNFKILMSELMHIHYKFYGGDRGFYVSY